MKLRKHDLPLSTGLSIAVLASLALACTSDRRGPDAAHETTPRAASAPSPETSSPAASGTVREEAPPRPSEILAP